MIARQRILLQPATPSTQSPPTSEHRSVPLFLFFGSRLLFIGERQHEIAQPLQPQQPSANDFRFFFLLLLLLLWKTGNKTPSFTFLPISKSIGRTIFFLTLFLFSAYCFVIKDNIKYYSLLISLIFFLLVCIESIVMIQAKLDLPYFFVVAVVAIKLNFLCFIRSTCQSRLPTAVSVCIPTSPWFSC